MSEKLSNRDPLHPKIGWWNKPTNHPNLWAGIGIILIILVFFFIVL